MDKKLLEQYGLQGALKRFQQINEYTFITSPIISEDGEEDEQGMMDSNADNQQMPPNIPQGDNNVPNNNVSQEQNGNDMPNNQDSDEQLANNMEMPDENSDMETDFGGEGVENDNTEEQEGDTVIDVDDLTQSQETTEVKIDGVDDKLTRMLSLLGKFETALEASDKKIDDLRNEFEKRNPSEQEKLNIRSQASYPYSETPKDYWEAKKETNPHYNVMYDNDVSTSDEQKKFDITRDDTKNINMNSISKSFGLNDFVDF